MAGDWIKMTVGLRSHPKVVRMSSALKADRLRIIGGLHAVWSLFDQHSVDGVLDGYCLAVLDEEIGWPGFAAAMSAVGWLQEGPESIAVPRFDTHNGASAKRRALDAERKRAERASKEDAHPNPVPPVSAPEADKTVTRGRGEEEVDDDDAGASAHAGEGAREATGAPAPAPVAGEPEWKGEPYDNPSTATKRGQWVRWFQGVGHQLDATCASTTTTLDRWVHDKVTIGEVTRALDRAQERGRGSIGDLIAYLDTVIADQRAAAAQAAAKAPPEHRDRGDQHKAGAAVPSAEETKRAAEAEAATKPDKAHLAEQARKAKAERDRIAAAKLAAAPTPAEGAEA